jgi:hypothetical protein
MKLLVSKSDLERIALQEIRSYPGGENVLSIEVERDNGQPRGNGKADPRTASERADIDRIRYAAQTTSRRLKRRYDIRWGS